MARHSFSQEVRNIWKVYDDMSEVQAYQVAGRPAPPNGLFRRSRCRPTLKCATAGGPRAAVLRPNLLDRDDSSFVQASVTVLLPFRFMMWCWLFCGTVFALFEGWNFLGIGSGS